MDDRPRAPRDDRGHAARRPDARPEHDAPPRAAEPRRTPPPERTRVERPHGRQQDRGTPAGSRDPREDRRTAAMRNAMAPTDRTTPVRPRPPDRSTRPTVSGRPDGRTISVITGRTVLALVSVVALLGTGYAWSTLDDAQSGLQTANVLDQQHKPSDGSMNILLVGMDSRTDAKGNPLPAAQLAALHAGPDQGEIDTDTLILLHIPNGGGKAIGVSIPRDSWVDIPGYGFNKINSAYGFAKNSAERRLRAQGVTGAQLEVQSDVAGARETIKVVEALTGVGIDHYAAINLEGFDQISNAIGGVPVCLLHAVNDRLSGADFHAGQFTVQGVQALEFVRQRHSIPGGSTDIEREERQQAFLASMAHKMLSTGVLTNPVTLHNLIGAVQDAVTIDNQWNLIDFAQEMSGMSSGAIKFQTIPTVDNDYHPYGTASGEPSAIKVDQAQVSAFVHGVTGVPTSASGGPPSDAPTGNAAITVDVTNASGTTGLAKQVLNQLGQKGFTQGQAGNGTHRTSSVLYFAPGQEAQAQAVEGALPGQFLLEDGPSVPSGHVWVYLGSDFHGASDTSDVVGQTPRPALDIAAPVATAPPTTGSAPTGGTAPISDSGTAPCIN